MPNFSGPGFHAMPIIRPPPNRRVKALSWRCRAALADAGLDPADIDYINLHGTGTPDNDLTESKAVNKLFSPPPLLSSIKGATGHSLAAAGAIEAVVSAITVANNLVPANTGCTVPDPALGLVPLTNPGSHSTTAVLSNSFGFGGNNACLLITKPDRFPRPAPKQSCPRLAIHGCSCLTGAGGTVVTMSMLKKKEPVAGMAGLDTISENLPPRLVRRLKRLPRIVLSLAASAHEDSGLEDKPTAVFMGTGWGALSETCDFLTRLSDSQEQFPSPTDFVGSVHNGPASQVAIMFGATGPNITTSGGDYSFEQALLATELVLDDPEQPALVLGADEGHHAFSPLFDPSIATDSSLADGGGALCLSRKREGAKCTVRLPYYQSSTADAPVEALIDSLGGKNELQTSCRLVLVGIPAAMHRQGERQLAQFLKLSRISAPVIRYRRFTGEFASASAVAAVLAVSFLTSGQVPGALVEESDIPLDNTPGKILVLGLGRYISAMEFSRP